ncbi:hypothetical protein HDU67_005270 [Dinochytrium kinnereticum]|nr:hypothetical protein HDU67_005270 [Dinochytrium kinnereticum]
MCRACPAQTSDPDECLALGQGPSTPVQVKGYPMQIFGGIIPSGSASFGIYMTACQCYDDRAPFPYVIDEAIVKLSAIEGLPDAAGATSGSNAATMTGTTKSNGSTRNSCAAYAAACEAAVQEYTSIGPFQSVVYASGNCEFMPMCRACPPGITDPDECLALGQGPSTPVQVKGYPMQIFGGVVPRGTASFVRAWQQNITNQCMPACLASYPNGPKFSSQIFYTSNRIYMTACQCADNRAPFPYVVDRTAIKLDAIDGLPDAPLVVSTSSAADATSTILASTNSATVAATTKTNGSTRNGVGFKWFALTVALLIGASAC